MSEVNRDMLRVPFDTMRANLAENEVTFGLPPHAPDQIQSMLRQDLTSLGIDTGDPEQIAAALAGFAVAMKVCLQQGVEDVPLYVQFVVVFDQGWFLLQHPVETTLEQLESLDIGSLNLCRQCLGPCPVGQPLCDLCKAKREAGATPARMQPPMPTPPPGHVVVRFVDLDSLRQFLAANGGRIPDTTQVVVAPGAAGSAFGPSPPGIAPPHVGGPGFQRGPDPEPEEPKRGWPWR